MTPSRPYLIRALYEWIIDNACTPYVSVDAQFPRVSVPNEYVIGGMITLDISMEATKQLLIDNEALTGQARFGGRVFELYLPIGSILAIYAKETQHGMTFPREEYSDQSNATQQHPDVPAATKPKFQLVE